MNATLARLASPSRVQVKQREQFSMPVIDFGKLHQTTASRSLVIRDLEIACKDKGCFQVVNHGVSKSIMNGALEAASEFFESSAESKAEFESHDITKPVRYNTSSNDGIIKSRYFLKHYAYPLDRWQQYWPLEPITYREKMGNYAAEVRRVALGLMDAILQSLDLGQTYLGQKLDEGMQVLSVNSYPMSTQTDVSIGLAAHSDYGFLTILLPSCPGLEIMEHDTKDWKSVPQPLGTLHVHIGDHLEVLSNGRFKSLVHRAVLNGDRARVSVASIHGLSMGEKVKCADKLVDKSHPELYRESSFNDFLDFLPSSGGSDRSYIESLRIEKK
ncbi:hypothetical protein LUZ60_011707 [Juncus effusus]|nr:hypothetical protein LUZ60_011707 [Juncus effusus]